MTTKELSSPGPLNKIEIDGDCHAKMVDSFTRHWSRSVAKNVLQLYVVSMILDTKLDTEFDTKVVMNFTKSQFFRSLKMKVERKNTAP